VVVIAISVVLFWTARRWVYYARSRCHDLEGDGPKARLRLARTSLRRRRSSPRRRPQSSQRPRARTSLRPPSPSLRRLSRCLGNPASDEGEDEPAPAESEPAAPTRSRRRPARRRSKLNRVHAPADIPNGVHGGGRSAVRDVPAALPVRAFRGVWRPGCRRGAWGTRIPGRRPHVPMHRFAAVHLPAIKRDRATGKFTPSGDPVDASQEDQRFLCTRCRATATSPCWMTFLCTASQRLHRPAREQAGRCLDRHAQAEPSLDPRVTLDNFATAIDWAGNITKTGPEEWPPGCSTPRSSPASPPLERSYRAWWSRTVRSVQVPGRDVLFLV